MYLILNTEFIFWLNITGCHPETVLPLAHILTWWPAALPGDLIWITLHYH